MPGPMSDQYQGPPDPLYDAAQLCLTGKCDCPTAAQCKFDRCTNCDSPMSEGASLDDRWAEEWNRCPDCGSPLYD